MKKLLCMLVALMMVFSFAACGEEVETVETEVEEVEVVEEVVEVDPAIQAFIDENGDELLASFKTSFEETQGLTTTCEIYGDGTTLVIDCNINGINDLTDDQKATLQAAYDDAKEGMVPLFAPFKEAVPELTGVTFNICEEDGDVAASIAVEL